MTGPTHLYPKPRVLGVIVGLIGTVLAALGALLVVEGGTPYYLLAGLVLLVIGILVFRGYPRGATAYGVFLLVTLLWSIYEVQFDAWALMPRLAMFSVLGLWFLFTLG